MRGFSATAAALLAVSACSPAQPDAASPVTPVARAELHPQSGLEIVPLTVTTRRGTHRFRVEVARSTTEQSRGLMFRTEMGPDEGMLFPLDAPREASFWMKNTVIPLDIIFIGTDGRIVNVEANTVPYSEEPRRSDGPVKAVLEINAGRAAELGIAPGDMVEW